MNDRELLEAAAKAGGVPIGAWYAYSNAFYRTGERAEWNPLTDDGDALRLACTLRMSLNFSTAKNGPDTAYADPLADVIAVPTDWTPATMRRAIVRAAAALAEPPK